MGLMAGSSVLIETSPPSASAAGEPAPVTLPLWPGPAPLARGTGPADVPQLIFYPAKDSGLRPAIVIFPGGGYGFLSLDFEGAHIARWFQERGLAAFIVKYRVPKLGYRYPAPYLDARRALRLVRSEASRWRLDPRQIGVIGFSAGGHLAGLLATAANSANAAAADPVDRVSDRPDFVILAYPVVTMLSMGRYSHSRLNLLGPHPDPNLEAELSIDRRVTPAMPPTLLLYSEDDPIVPAGPNAVALAAALAQNHVPHQVIAYPHGGHGWGLGHQPERGPAHWLDQVEAWLKTRGVAMAGPGRKA